MIKANPFDPIYAIDGLRNQNLRMRFVTDRSYEWYLGRQGAIKYLQVFGKDANDVPRLKEDPDSHDLSHLIVALAIALSNRPPSSVVVLTKARQKQILKGIRELVDEVDISGK